MTIIKSYIITCEASGCQEWVHGIVPTVKLTDKNARRSASDRHGWTYNGSDLCSYHGDVTTPKNVKRTVTTPSGIQD